MTDSDGPLTAAAADDGDVATTTTTTNSNSPTSPSPSSNRAGGSGTTTTTTTTTSAGTSVEEIERQHREALRIVKEEEEDGGRLSIPTSRCCGEIPVKYKARPTCELFEERKNDNNNGCCSIGTDECVRAGMVEEKEDGGDSIIPSWSSRGNVDVAALQVLFREGYNRPASSAADGRAGQSEPPQADDDDDDSKKKTRRRNNRRTYRASDVESVANLWDDANAAVNNVWICRPSHDAWGIKKVVLIFSDDFLRQTYEMPWWHARQDIRDAVGPVLKVLGIESHDRIARLLLASLPPGVTIPVHHDTGEWVKHTHRVHVPILVKNPSRVLFQCGLTTSEMHRIDCTPGHVFEINNQSKHAVSNCDTDHRVHLILDYFDASFDGPTDRVRLRPGEVIVQTRRSIDRLSNRGQRSTPSFLILGAQKAGTTSLYEYMNQHPLIVRARRRETHCLDWRWNESLKTVEKQREWCHKFFFKDDLDLHPSCMTGDSTPSYLLDSRRVIPRLKRVFNWKVKFLVMLRDPVRRAESHFAMVTSDKGTEAQLKVRGSEWRNKSIREVIKEELNKMSDCGLIPYFDVENGYVDKTAFDEFAGSDREDRAWDKYVEDIPMNTGSHCLLARGMYAVNLRPWLTAFDPRDFLVLKLESMQEVDGVERQLEKVWEHLHLPSIQIEDDAPRNQREYDSLLDSEMQAYLYRFYEPHNQRLVAMLGEEWRNVWPTSTENRRQ